MKTMLKPTTVLIAFVRIAGPFLTTGKHIREVTAPSEVTADYSEMERLNQFLHLFALNQSSEYLVKNLATGEFTTYKSEGELPDDKRGVRLWQKFTSFGMLLYILDSFISTD